MPYFKEMGKLEKNQRRKVDMFNKAFSYSAEQLSFSASLCSKSQKTFDRFSIFTKGEIEISDESHFD